MSLHLAGVLALLLQAVPAAPPADATEILARQRAATALIASLQSPFCPGLTLPACPSWHADTLRQSLRHRVELGESPVVLRQEMAQRYGQYVLGEPTWHGFDVLGWLAPAALLLAAGAGLVLGLRRRAAGVVEATDAPPAGPPTRPPLAPEERARLERQLLAELRQEL